MVEDVGFEGGRCIVDGEVGRWMVDDVTVDGRRRTVDGGRWMMDGRGSVSTWEVVV